MSDLFYPSTDLPLYPLPTAGRTSAEIGSCAEEILPIVNEKGMVTASALRSWVHGGAKPLHPVVHLHLISRRGEFYLQRRSLAKSLYPGYWDTAVGGHVSFGESIGEALLRESSEELGLQNINPVPLDCYVYESPDEKELVYVFGAAGDFSPRPDPEEVMDGRFWTQAEIESNYGSGVLTPNFESEFRRIRGKLEALL